MKSILAVGLCIATAITVVPLALSGSNERRAADDQLGSVNFPTSCNAVAQSAIVSGVASLHSFQYEQSDDTFKRAAEADPKCAMAHWGEAMSRYHQLWENPDKDALSHGRAELSVSEKIGGGTDRERGYIAAAQAYFQDSPGLTYTDRVRAYSGAMEKVHTANPNDTDAAAFYALSLVALSYDDQKNSDADRQQALAILQPLFAQQPNHPGLAHYIIHATDTPKLAPQGLDAARRYAKIAPDSSHALHMPSHIFTRLGLWQESIDSNIAAVASAEKATLAHTATANYQFHPMDFLAYTYAQTGQAGKANTVIAELKNVPGGSAHQIKMHEAYMSARNMIDLHEWKEAADLPVLDLSQSDLVDTYWAKSIGASRSGNATAAKEQLAKLIAAIAAFREEAKSRGDQIHEGKPVDQLEAEGWLAFAEGRADDAVASMHDAVTRDESEGIESVSIPAREMLADLLLALKRPAEAQKEYIATLKETPFRFDSEFGAAMAANAADDKGIARDYAVHLQHRCGPDADRPEIRVLTLSIDRRWPH